MLSKRYTFSELNKILMESSNEFNPRIGDKVESEDKKNNEKAVDDIMKQSKEFDGGITDKKKNTNKEDIQDFNKTTLDVDFASKPSDEYVKRVKAQVHGFPSADNEENSKIEEENDSLDFEGNKNFYDTQKKKSEEVDDMETDIKHAGLKARELPKKHFENDTLFKENKTMKRLHFKNTVFLSEAQMLKKVPEEFKSADGRFIMKDASGTEYLVECSYNKDFKHGKLTVVNKTNKEQINEQLERMRQLTDYSSSSYMGGTNSMSRKNETNGLSEMIDRVKDMEKNGIND
jgi:hypothetical protein